MTTPLLEVLELSRSFSGVAALDGVSLEVRESEILAILGPNGSGKTTLFNVISGFMTPSSGTILFEGRSVGGKRPRRMVEQGLARSFQQSMSFSSFTVRENLAIARVGKARREIDRDHLLQVCGLEEVADRPSRSLAYGLQRKLGVAIALSTSPRLVLLDEPAAGLSETDAAELAEVITTLPSQGVSVACIDHNLPFLLPIADRVVVLDAGRKIFDGSPAAARESPAVVEAYLGSSHE